MTAAQTEARAIVEPFLGPIGVMPDEEDEIVSVIADALAAKDAELARRDMQLEASAKVALDLSARLEALEAENRALREAVINLLADNYPETPSISAARRLFEEGEGR